MSEFHLIDLVSQAREVQKRLSGLSLEEKLEWLASHGTMDRVESSLPERPVFRYETRTGIKCGFFFDGDELVFMGDHTTFTAPERD